MEERVPPDGVRRCWRGPAYHFHGEWFVVGVVAPLLLFESLVDRIGSGFLFLIMLFIWLMTYGLANRHEDPERNIWVND